jgi:HK97 family phage major capsid protein
MSLKKILEQRTIGSSTNIPEKVFDRVLLRLKDESPFFKHSTFMIATDRNKVTILSDVDGAEFEVAVLDLKELRASMKVTVELYNNNEEVETYLEEKIYAKVLETIEKDFAKELAITPGEANKVTDTLGIPMLLKMRRQLKTSYLKGAVWIVDRATYNTLAETLMGDKPLIKSEILNGFVSLSMLGHPLYVVETISNDVKIVFANLRRGFAIRMLNEISVKKLAEIGYIEGAQVYALNTMYCGKVIETASIVQGNYTPKVVMEEPVAEEPVVEEVVVEVIEKQAEEPVKQVEKKAKTVTEEPTKEKAKKSTTRTRKKKEEVK